MRIPENVINEISDRLNMVEIVGSYVRLERRGNRYWGLCPFHSEKTPSFTLLPDLKGFHCFGCGKGGSMFSFIQEIENMPFPEAVEMLADKAGIEIPRQVESGDDKRRAALKELYNRVAGSFHYILKNNDSANSARGYLEKRGITPETQDVFTLGYAPAEREWLFRFLRSKNYSEDFLAQSGLFSRNYKKTSLFWKRIIFPIKNARGDVVAFGGRLLEGDGPKYINSPETELFQKSRNLYGLHNSLPDVRKNRKFIVVEGYFDVIAFHMAGIGGCVAPLGTALTVEQVHMLNRYAGEGVLVFDGDDAGVKAAVKALVVCEGAGIDCRVIELPEGRDPADVVEQDGPGALQNLLKYPINGFTFVVRNAIKGSDAGRAGAKENVVRQLLPILGEVQSEVRRETYIHELADALRVDPNSVQRDITRLNTQRIRRQTGEEESSELRVTPDLFLMLAVAANFHMFKDVRGKIGREDLEDEAARSLFVSLEDAYRNEETSFDSILSRIDDERVRKALTERSASGEFSENYVEIVSDSVGRVRERSMIKNRVDVQTKIRALEQGGGTMEEIRELLEEKMFLDTELEKIRGRKV
jgi:DNA primase